MICHRTIGPAAMYTTEDCLGNSDVRWDSPWPRSCIGSRCAMWVPAVRRVSTNSGALMNLGDDGCSLDPPQPYDTENPPVEIGKVRTCDDVYAGWTGWCADNLCREPWPDPAAKEQA